MLFKRDRQICLLLGLAVGLCLLDFGGLGCGVLGRRYVLDFLDYAPGPGAAWNL